MSVRVDYADRAEQARDLASIVAAQLTATINARDHATLVVAGGSTPAPFLRALSGAEVEWSSVTVLPSDERMVPQTSDRSNARMIGETLLQGPAAAARFIALAPEAEGTPADAAARAATDRIVEVLPVDICVVGMGADMHTASLFPGADKLADALSAGAPAVLPITAPGAQEPRLTLTAPILSTATHLHLLIAGADKADALARAEDESDPRLAPVRVVLTAAGVVTVHYAP